MNGDPTNDYLADPRLLRCVRDMALPGAGARYPRIALPRPLFVPRREVADLADDVLRLLDIYESLPERCFGGDPGAYQAAQGNSPRRVELQRTGLTGGFVPMGRIDAMAAGGTLKVMEINIGSGVGGMGVAKLCRGLLRDPVFREFADHHGLGFDDPLEALVREVRRTAEEVVGVADPVTVLIEDNQGVTSQGRAVAEDLNRLGLRTTVCSVDDLDVRDGRITLSGQGVDAAIRSFILQDLVIGYARPEQVAMLARAHLDGRTALVVGLDSDLHSAKGSLALLHDPRVWPALTPAERDLVTRRVPWTRVLTDDKDLVEECVARRADLVLKPVFGFKGTGVMLGSETKEETWLAATSDPHETYVVQERLHSPPHVVLDAGTGEPEEWDANLGVYFDRHGYVGTWIRARRTADGGVIGMNERTRPGCAFTY